MRAGRFIPIHFVPICDGASFIGGLIEALTFQNGKRRADYWNRVSVSMEQVAGKWAKSAEAQMLIDGALGFCGIHGEGSSDARVHPFYFDRSLMCSFYGQLNHPIALTHPYRGQF